MADPNKRKKLSPAALKINNSHDRAYLARDTGPDGREIVEHAIVTTGRMIDRLREQGRVNDDQHAAATMVRNWYERANLSMGKLRATDPEGQIGHGGTPDFVSDEGAWRHYRTAMQQCIHEWKIIRSVVIDDQSPAIYGARMRCEGFITLQIALNKLARHLGLTNSRRASV